MFVLNNGFLGMVRQWEDMFNEGHHYETCLNRNPSCDAACIQKNECRFPNPNLLNLSAVYPGIRTLRIKRSEDVREVLEEVLSNKEPYLVDVWIDRGEDVKPMIPPGGTLNDIIYDLGKGVA
jgi:acetolactate synthase-1/2/3 large subunit